MSFPDAPGSFRAPFENGEVIAASFARIHEELTTLRQKVDDDGVRQRIDTTIKLNREMQRILVSSFRLPGAEAAAIRSNGHSRRPFKTKLTVGAD